MKNAHGRTCKKTKVYIYLYISPYENVSENGCIYNIYKESREIGMRIEKIIPELNGEYFDLLSNSLN